MRVLQSTLKLLEKEVSISAPWGHIKGLTWGNQSNPPILLVHGVADTCSSFRPLVSLLPTKYFYVGIDLPGNGRSDHLPKGIRYSAMDLLPTLWTVKEHFRWNKFGYIGHSLGCVLGKYFSVVYPDIITRTVELDPLPAYQLTPPDEFRSWYHKTYERYYNPGNYEKFNKTDEAGPKYTYEKAVETLQQARGLTKDQADCVLERCLTSTPDGLYRFTFDPRMRVYNFPVLPMTLDYCQKMYTSVKTPVFCLFAKDLVDMQAYKKFPFALDEKEWPNGNYRCKIVKGMHDFFLMTPEYIAKDISEFLEESYIHAKL